MGCKCGQNRDASRFKLTLPDGSTSIHGTRRSAELARERKGGKGTIDKVSG